MKGDGERGWRCGGYVVARCTATGGEVATVASGMVEWEPEGTYLSLWSQPEIRKISEIGVSYALATG